MKDMTTYCSKLLLCLLHLARMRTLDMLQSEKFRKQQNWEMVEYKTMIIKHVIGLIVRIKTWLYLLYGVDIDTTERFQ